MTATMNTLPTSAQSLPQQIVAGSRVCEDGPEIGWPVLAGISHTGTDRENRCHRRLDEQAKGKGPIDAADEHLPHASEELLARHRPVQVADGGVTSAIMIVPSTTLTGYVCTP